MDRADVPAAGPPVDHHRRPGRADPGIRCPRGQDLRRRRGCQGRPGSGTGPAGHPHPRRHHRHPHRRDRAAEHHPGCHHDSPATRNPAQVTGVRGDRRETTQEHMMAPTTWTFGPNGGDYTASFDGVQTVIVTVTATGAFVTSASSAVAGLEAAPALAAARGRANPTTPSAPGASVTSGSSAVAGLEAAQSVAAAMVGANTTDVSAEVAAGITAALAGDVHIAGNVTIGG